ncbi:hypothetical protein SERLA73DRAFT_139153 [Serpula lacrymans var. lacrymans S7.3]|uniref:Uncharacterized protein n=2 Tax=Serpula lacrymans var. lacrymans TaxID=341189 RepID=F8Q3L0_SERL3|nr:uncharacterized protein SERLADRAFT_393206 [Serpula lacrymans var. lacrymans S7.9]EGN97095.1 hypothetical protein SERLA73DRAFT_139153 [Serpula lacrymans var. lacrymans S7.3]EGO22702.1 hypothetical protein SERLADRAFT_393206 [Serpula lacrymans var. lacrymans S7.9]
MASLSIARAYQHFFETHPNRTLAVTGGVLNALGDVVAQISQNFVSLGEHEQRPGFDPVRTLRFFCFGFGLSPLLGRWNLFLEHRFPLRARRGLRKVSFKALTKRVAADQLLMAPLGLFAFVGSMGVMEGRSPAQIQEKYMDMYRPALMANWQVWPLAQMINFRYMPLPYRVPFQATCGVFWTLYLSILNSREDEKQDKEHSIKK